MEMFSIAFVHASTCLHANGCFVVHDSCSVEVLLEEGSTVDILLCD